MLMDGSRGATIIRLLNQLKKKTHKSGHDEAQPSNKQTSKQNPHKNSNNWKNLNKF